VQAASPDSPPSHPTPAEPRRQKSRAASTVFVAVGCALVLGFGVFALAQGERSVAAATQSNEWISNCTTPGVVAFTGSASAALAWMSTPPQTGQCWTILYSNPDGSSPSSTTTTKPTATTTTLPKICVKRAYDHRRLCHVTT
jgi:hypothetical protein